MTGAGPRRRGDAGGALSGYGAPEVVAVETVDAPGDGCRATCESTSKSRR